MMKEGDRELATGHIGRCAFHSASPETASDFDQTLIPTEGSEALCIERTAPVPEGTDGIDASMMTKAVHSN